MDKSGAVQVIIALIPIVGIVMGSIVVFFYLLWDHKRKTLLIEAGLYSRPTFDLLSFSLLAGILLLSVGSALTVVFAVALGLGIGLLGGIIPLALGIGLLVYYAMKHSDRKL
ncbi:MAG: hypothetical protein LBC46_00435 [Treponema sp.]|nr:hypothetical protein [Treponema sp.]